MKLKNKIFLSSLPFLAIIPSTLAFVSCSAQVVNDNPSEPNKPPIINTEEIKKTEYKKAMIDAIITELTRPNYEFRITNQEWLDIIRNKYNENIKKDQSWKYFLAFDDGTDIDKSPLGTIYFDNEWEFGGFHQQKLEIIENENEIIVNNLDIQLGIIEKTDAATSGKWGVPLYKNFKDPDFRNPISFKIIKT